MPEEHFFVSDLHIGGDMRSEVLDLEDDLIAFPKALEKREKDAEPVVIGDSLVLPPTDHARLFGLSVLQLLVARKPQRDAPEDVPERTVIG